MNDSEPTLRGDNAWDKLRELGGQPAELTEDGWWMGLMPGWHAVHEHPKVIPFADLADSEHESHDETRYRRTR